ncbi:hypothetical protein PV325_006370, partial [Microctonus aethiopoides]
MSRVGEEEEEEEGDEEEDEEVVAERRARVEGSRICSTVSRWMAGEGGLGWRLQSESHYDFLGRRAELNQDGSRAESARTPLVLLLIVTQ